MLDYIREQVPGGPGLLSRLRLDPASGHVGHERLAEARVAFPRVDDRQLTRPHQVIAVTRPDGCSLAWFDTRTGRLATWAAGPLIVGEQTFVPHPGDPDPARGWWLTFATDRTDLTSRLLVVPAGDPAGGPVAAVRLPQRVPPGQHGTWLPSAT